MAETTDKIKTINLNDKVSVVLTDAGLDAYHDFYRGVTKKTNAPKKKDGTGMFDDQINRTDTKLTEQLWSLIEIFGSNINIFSPQMFKKNELTAVINLYDQCPCGSGKIYMQCCGEQ
jgi:hypothetical protein